MKYVKLTARPNTWFKAGTEVYDYDKDYSAKIRVSLEYWEQCKSECGICVRGIRVCESGYEIDSSVNGGMGCKLGEERIDGEYCHCDEFDVEIVDGI